VLALEYIDGLTRVTSPDGGEAARSGAATPWAEAMLELFFLELYDWGTAADGPEFRQLPHSVRRAEGDELVLLDFGSTLLL
jgi:hypothetical protein